jgi:hypothetical protein
VKQQSTRSCALLLIAAGLIATGALATRDLMVGPRERWVPAGTFFVAPFVLLPGALMLGYVLSKGGNRWTIPSLLAGSVIGFLGGLLFFPGVSVFRELARRMSWASTDGRGEAAAWGEPLFYIIVCGVPVGLLGAIIGMSLVAVMRLARRKTSGIGMRNHGLLLIFSQQSWKGFAVYGTTPGWSGSSKAPGSVPAWAVNTFVCYSLSKARARTAFSASLKTYPMPAGAADPLGHSSQTA